MKNDHIAERDGKYAAASDESEKIDLVVAAGAASEGKTSGYVASEGGMGPMGGGAPADDAVEGTEEMEMPEEGAPADTTVQVEEVPATEE